MVTNLLLTVIALLAGETLRRVVRLEDRLFAYENRLTRVETKLGLVEDPCL